MNSNKSIEPTARQPLTFVRIREPEAAASRGSCSTFGKMKGAFRILLSAALLLLAGCVTNDFKVVDSLKAGMTPQEAQETIKSFGFTLSKSLPRPAAGWPAERKAFDATDWRAGREEARTGKPVSLVEYYPVGHGMLGAGELFLFYGDDGQLASFYRHQIN